MEICKTIFNANIRSVFEDYIASINIPDIDYFAIGVQDAVHRKSISMMSRLEWQKDYKTYNYAERDPVRLAALNTNRNVICFDEVDYLDALGNEVMMQRKRYGIRNGIMVVDRKLSHNFVLTLATDYKKFDGNQFYLKNHNDIYKIFEDFKAMIKPVSKTYRFEKP